MMWRIARTGRGLAAAMAGLVVLAVLAALPGGCPTQPEPQDGTTDVSIRNMAFVPKEVTIQAGQSVRWTNEEPTLVQHTTTSGDPGEADAGDLWDSGLMDPGESFTQPFDTPGEYVYHCEVHPTEPGMRDAKVIVQPAP